jgi:hypothetical protein
LNQLQSQDSGNRVAATMTWVMIDVIHAAMPAQAGMAKQADAEMAEAVYTTSSR